MSRALLATAGAVAPIVALLLLLWMTQRRLIYLPDRDAPRASDRELRIEPVTFPTSDGLELKAWFVPAAASPARATVLVFNGNAGNRGNRLPLAAAFQQHGFQVLLTDYRGYGGNPGTPSERGLSADSRAAHAYLARRPDVDASRLVYFGESLGAAVAVDLAVEHPPASLILRSPFTSLADIAQHHYWFLPTRLLLRDRFPSVERIGTIRAPLLVIAGDRDQIVPFDHSRRLYDAAPEPKAFAVIADSDHNDYELLAGDDLIQTAVQFIERW